MDNKQFKKTFGDIAKSNGFRFAFGGWYKESQECILTLDLQKSNYSNLYYLNIKIHVQGAFGKRYTVTKFLIKNATGNFFRRHEPKFDDALNLDINIEDEKRKEILEDLFNSSLAPFSEKALHREGIKELIRGRQLFLLPAVKKTLGFDDLEVI